MSTITVPSRAGRNDGTTPRATAARSPHWLRSEVEEDDEDLYGDDDDMPDLDDDDLDVDDDDDVDDDGALEGEI